MINLLHLTDLHVGCDPDATARAQRAGALDLLAKVLGGLEADWKPHVLGDFRGSDVEGTAGRIQGACPLAEEQAVRRDRTDGERLRRLPGESRSGSPA
ncbi:MAG: hypothetical protein ACKV22_13210 [Bryobacteraceae bacterium]